MYLASSLGTEILSVRFISTQSNVPVLRSERDVDVGLLSTSARNTSGNIIVDGPSPSISLKLVSFNLILRYIALVACDFYPAKLSRYTTMSRRPIHNVKY